MIEGNYTVPKSTSGRATSEIARQVTWFWLSVPVVEPSGQRKEVTCTLVKPYLEYASLGWKWSVSFQYDRLYFFRTTIRQRPLTQFRYNILLGINTDNIINQFNIEDIHSVYMRLINRSSPKAVVQLEAWLPGKCFTHIHQHGHVWRSPVYQGRSLESNPHNCAVK